MATYTNHIGHHSRDTFRGKDTSISTVGKLAAAEKHNNHEYTQADIDRMQSDINLDLRHLNRHYVMVGGELVEVEGRLNLCDNVRKIYEEEFADAISEYNRRQVASGHYERQIFDYLKKVSEDKKQEVAVEGLIQIGSFDEEWSRLSLGHKLRMVPILQKALVETIRELNKDVNGEKRRFVLAGASLHLDEGSPHIHYIGVPIVESQTAVKGLRKRVKKSGVFTKDSLGTGLQDNVRAKIEPLVMSEFGWRFDVKKTGRNEDREKRVQVNEMLQAKIEEKEQTLEALERRVSTVETIEEYQKEANELDSEISSSERKLDSIRELEDLIPFHKRRKASEIIDGIYRDITNSLKWMKAVLARLLGYEQKSNMEQRKRRSPSLAERIGNAEKRVAERERGDGDRDEPLR